MKAELSRIILFVDDIAKMSEFYGNVLGLRKLPGETDGWVCFAAGACEVCLHTIPAQYRSESTDYPKREDSSVKLVFRSDNVEADRAALIEKGVRMNETISFENLEFCDGADPEGNIFQISSRS